MGSTHPRSVTHSGTLVSIQARTMNELILVPQLLIVFKWKHNFDTSEFRIAHVGLKRTKYLLSDSNKS